MTTPTVPSLSPEGIRAISEALAGSPPVGEQQISVALRIHEGVRRWWEGLILSLSKGLEGNQARALMAVQVVLCGADAVFLRVALDNAPIAKLEDTALAKRALAEASEIETKARQWLTFAGETPQLPVAATLANGMDAYECGDSLDLKQAVQRLKARCT